MAADPFAPIISTPAANGTASSSPAQQWRTLSPVPLDAPAHPATHPKRGKPSATWEYRDARAALLFIVQRFETSAGKEFRPLSYCENATTGEREWRYVGLAAPRPLYRLDALADRVCAPVIVCEGEKAAEAAQRLAPGHVATCSPSGSKSAAKADWSPLAGRDVLIWPDADAPGADYAQAAAKHARAAGAASVAILKPPSAVDQGWDAADAEAEGWTPAQVVAFLSNGRENGAAPAAEEAGKPDNRRRVPQRDVIIGAVEHVDLWHGPDGDTFATFKVGLHRENWPIRSSAFRRWLACEVYEATSAVPGAQAIEDALRILEARATRHGAERAPWLRVGSQGNKLYVDLCDSEWRVVEIDANGWRVLDRHDCPFLRAQAMRPLPEPEAGFEIDVLRGYVNADDADFMLICAWLVAALRPHGPYPILAIGGEQGSGKSSISRLVRSLTDPNSAPIRAAPRDDRDLLVSAINSHVLAFDNLSRVEAWLADAWCRMATGGGFATRALHTDREEIVLQAKRPIALNGIPELTTRPDLADRAIPVRLKAIPESERRPEDEIEAELARDLPRILGALLDGVSAGLRNIGKVKLVRLPRLADFAKWIVACAPGLGFDPDDLLDAYMNNRRDAGDGAFEADTVAVAIRALSESEGYWSGTPTDLLQRLGELVSENVKRSRSWPMTAQGLGNAIERVAPLLRDRGVSVTRKHSGVRSITIARLSPADNRKEAGE